MRLELSRRSPFLNAGCTLHSPGDILKLQISKSQPEEINQNLCGCRLRGGETQISVIFEVSQMNPICSQA